MLLVPLSSWLLLSRSSLVLCQHTKRASNTRSAQLAVSFRLSYRRFSRRTAFTMPPELQMFHTLFAASTLRLLSTSLSFTQATLSSLRVPSVWASQLLFRTCLLHSLSPAPCGPSTALAPRQVRDRVMNRSRFCVSVSLPLCGCVACFHCTTAIDVLVKLFMPLGDFAIDWLLYLTPAYWQPQVSYASFDSVSDAVRQRAPLFPEPVFVVETAELLSVPELMLLIHFGEDIA